MNQPIRTLIIDDELLARERILRLLGSQTDVQVVGECADGATGLEMIARVQPDLIFLDVQMPDMDGFAMLRKLEPSPLPVVVFTTAYDEHALRAFEVSALDYLLKPYKVERFEAAVARAREQVARVRLGAAARDLRAALEAHESTPPPAPWLRRITVKDGDKVKVVRVDEIDCIESAGNYVGIQVGRDNHIVRETLSVLESQLDPAQFLRIGRGLIVNIERVTEVHATAHGGHAVVLRGGRRLPMTRGLRVLEERLRYG